MNFCNLKPLKATVVTLVVLLALSCNSPAGRNAPAATDAPGDTVPRPESDMELVVPEAPATAYGAMGSMDPNYQRPYVTNEKQPMPPTYLAWSIVVMLLCCLIPGIVALIYSTKVSSAFSSGDYEGARSASNTAAMWVIISVVCGLVWIPFQFVLFFI